MDHRDPLVLREFVRSRRVVWEVESHRERQGHELVPVAWDLMISAETAGARADDPGGEDALAAWSALQDLVEQNLPDAPNGLHVEIEGWDSAIRFRERDEVPEVTLVVHVSRADATFAAPGPWEGAYVRRVIDSLEAMGVRSRDSLRSRPAAA